MGDRDRATDSGHHLTTQPEPARPRTPQWKSRNRPASQPRPHHNPPTTTPESPITNQRRWIRDEWSPAVDVRRCTQRRRRRLVGALAFGHELVPAPRPATRLAAAVDGCAPWSPTGSCSAADAADPAARSEPPNTWGRSIRCRGIRRRSIGTWESGQPPGERIPPTTGQCLSPASAECVPPARRPTGHPNPTDVRPVPGPARPALPADIGRGDSAAVTVDHAGARGSRAPDAPARTRADHCGIPPP